jgi:hypothetical protein
MKSAAFLKFLREVVGMFYAEKTIQLVVGCQWKRDSTYVINCGQSAVRPADCTAGVLETLEGLWRCNLVNKVSVNIDQASSIFLLIDDVVLENLVIQGLRF